MTSYDDLSDAARRQIEIAVAHFRAEPSPHSQACIERLQRVTSDEELLRVFNGIAQAIHEHSLLMHATVEMMSPETIHLFPEESGRAQDERLNTRIRGIQ